MDDEWAPGDVIAGQYRVLRVHGQGGMGLVYRVRHLGWNIDLAVKSPRAQLFRTDLDRERFVDEAQTWVQLGPHPHVCTCHYVRTLDGVPRVFAEYLPGGSLREWIDDHRLYRGTETETLQRILDLAVQTAWGLQHAHDHGLVHQDVKPANVLLDDDGTAKVTDFGLARGRPAQPGGTPSDLALSVAVAGGGLTPAYASPEQTAGRTLGRRSDVWSLGVSVLEMFTGGITWSAGPVAGAALEEYRRRGGPPAPHLPRMPEPVADLLARCLQFEPEARPRTVAAVADELAAAYRDATGTAYDRPAPRAADLRADGFSNRALSLLDLDRPDEADEAFAAALAVDPRHPYAIYNSALVRWRRGEIADDVAAGLVEDARAAAADPVHVGSLLARVHLERGAVTEARPLLAAAAADPATEPDVATALRDLDDGSLTTADGEDRFAAYRGHRPRLVGDGRHVALLSRSDELEQAYDSGTVVLWDVVADAAAHVLRGHTDALTALDVTPDLRVAVSSARDGTLRVWDVADGTCRHVFEGYGDRLTGALLVSADGRRAVGDAAGGGVRVWDLEAGAELRVARQGEAGSVRAVSADGRRAVLTDRLSVVVWDLDGDRLLSVLRDLPEPPLSATISADGRVAAYGDIRSRLAFWQVDGGSPRMLRSHGTGVLDVALSADGRLAATLASHGAVRIWDVGTGRCLRTCPGGRRLDFGALSFTAADRQVLVASADGQRRWSVPPGYVAPLLPCRPRSHADLLRREARALALVAEALEALAAERLPAALDLLRQARAIPGFERAAPVLHAWRQLGERSVRTGVRGVWSVPPLEGHTDHVHDVAAGPEPGQAVTSCHDGSVRRWDLETGRCLDGLGGLGHLTSVAVNRDGSRVVLLDAEAQELLSWHVGEQVYVLNTGVMRRAAVTPDGRVALVLGTDARLHLLDGTDGRLLRSFEKIKDDTHHLCLGGDARLAFDRDYKAVHVWDTTDGRCLGTFEAPGGNLEGGIAVSPDNRRGLVMTSTGWVWLWDAERGGRLRALTEHTNRVADAAFSADGRFAVSVAQDNTLRLWDLDSDECLRVVEIGEHLFTRVRFSADGRFVLAGTRTGPVLRWELDWELAAHDVSDDADAARPLLAAMAGTALLTGDAVPEDHLLRTLRYAGFGWIRPDAVRSAFRRATDTVGERSALDALPGLAERLAYEAAGGMTVRAVPEARVVYERLGSCAECAATSLVTGAVTPWMAGGTGRLRGLEVRCEACGAPFRYAVLVTDPEEEPTPPERWFGGPERSWHVDAHEWLAYADDCGSPFLAAAAVAEILKFVPDGADRVPRDRLRTRDGQDELERHPERYARAALEARLAAHLAAAGDALP